MKSTFADRWARKRVIGKKAYVLRYGLLLIGVGLVVLFSVLDVINNGTIEFGYLLSRLVFFPTLGAMVAGIRWESNERKFAKLASKPN